MFDLPPSDFVMILLRPQRGHELVDRYRDPLRLKSAIPNANQLVGLPAAPFVGEVSFADVAAILSHSRRWSSRCERGISDTVVQFLNARVVTPQTTSDLHVGTPNR
jgi:hypothetical protein